MVNYLTFHINIFHNLKDIFSNRLESLIYNQKAYLTMFRYLITLISDH